jgi:hypothetical protein
MSLTIINPTTGEEKLVALRDLGRMPWEDAKEACANLGSGWRLPTLEELQVMYEELHLKGKGNFDDDWYWSSTEEGADKAWLVFFIRGDDYDFNKDDHHQVRAVRAL